MLQVYTTGVYIAQYATLGIPPWVCIALYMPPWVSSWCI